MFKYLYWDKRPPQFFFFFFATRILCVSNIQFIHSGLRTPVLEASNRHQHNFNHWTVVTCNVTQRSFLLKNVFLFLIQLLKTFAQNVSDLLSNPILAFKAMVHFKMKMLSPFTHPQLFQTCMSFSSLLNTKEDILKNVGDQTVDGLVANTMEVNGVHQLSG